MDIIRPEVLAPAGDAERLKAAVYYGADAVYMGGTRFGMRAAPKNFSDDELARAVSFAHENGVKVYLTCNIIPNTAQLKELPEFLEAASAAGVDALIITDLGVLSYAKKYAPKVPIHISTQTGVANAESARMLFDLGAERVVSARELTLDELADLRAGMPKEMELECFVHGAMCVSYSGRCLLSNYLTDRHSNKGECSQPCRWEYSLMERTRQGEYFPVEETASGTYIMNSKDMCMIEHIPELIEARAIADWEIGLNATQALSIAAGQGIYSLGRVQTPTLMMICSRYLENRDFTPQTYFRLKVTAEKDGTPFAAISELRYETLPAANAALAAVTATGTVQVADVQRREVSQEPPLLYDLTALQKEANGRYGFSADKTLSVAQSLYEKKVLSYPRTGSRYLSDDVFDEIPDRIALLERYPAFAAHAAALKGASLNRRSVDAGKVTDHHALIITECLPGELSADERTVYDMVAARLLEAFSARCLKDVTTVSFTAGNSVFTAKGTVVRSAGWRAVRGERDEDDEGTAALPPLQPGEAFPLQSAECVEKQTKPRPLHTESSLLSAMEHCGRELRDDELRDSLKGNGIGTPATRASIIETLFARDYVRREKKSLVPTGKGLAVYQIVKDKRIADVEMTGQWETALAKIESGEMNPDTFRKGIEVYAAQITEELLQVQVSVADGGHIPCPKCRSGRILLYPKVAKCSNVDCGLTVFRNKGEKQLTDSQIADLVTKGKTSLIKGFRSRDGKPFDAYLTFDKDFRTVYGFPPRTDKPKGKERRR